MANKLKKMLAAFLAVTMLSSASCFVMAEETVKAETETEVKAEQNAGTVKFTIGEADENGIFTAKLSLHNINFISLDFGFSYNKDVIQAVDAEGNATDDFDAFATYYPAKMDGKSYDISQAYTSLSNADGVFRIISYVVVSTGDNAIHVDEDGQMLYEFRFKKMSDSAEYGFALTDFGSKIERKNAIVFDGEDVPFTFSFVYPDVEKNDVVYLEPPVVTEEPPVPTQKEWQAERLRGTVILQIGAYAVSVEGVIKWVDKDNKNVVPYIENDRTMVPLRFISEAMGAEVEWVADTRTIQIQLADTAITMQIDNKDYQLNGETNTMDTAPVIKEDRTFVPLRFVSEALDKSVLWDGNMGVVVVAPIDYPWDNTDPQTMELYTRSLMTMKWLGDEAYAYEEEK